LSENESSIIFMNSSNFKFSLPFGNSIAEGVEEFVVCCVFVSKLLKLPAIGFYAIFLLMPGLATSSALLGSSSMPSLLLLPI
jgi:hypothetical protein